MSALADAARATSPLVHGAALGSGITPVSKPGRGSPHPSVVSHADCIFSEPRRVEAIPLGAQESLPDGRGSDHVNVANSETLH